MWMRGTSRPARATWVSASWHQGSCASHTRSNPSASARRTSSINPSRVVLLPSRTPAPTLVRNGSRSLMVATVAVAGRDSDAPPGSHRRPLRCLDREDLGRALAGGGLVGDRVALGAAGQRPAQRAVQAQRPGSLLVRDGLGDRGGDQGLGVAVIEAKGHHGAVGETALLIRRGGGPVQRGAPGQQPPDLLDPVVDPGGVVDPAELLGGVAGVVDRVVVAERTELAALLVQGLELGEQVLSGLLAQLRRGFGAVGHGYLRRRPGLPGPEDRQPFTGVPAPGPVGRARRAALRRRRRSSPTVRGGGARGCRSA